MNPTAQDNLAIIDEDGTVTDSGNLITDDDGLGADNDPDGDSLLIMEVDGIPVSGPTTIDGEYGTLTVHPDGSYMYTVDSGPNARVLTEGQTAIETFVYTVTDGQGGTDTAELVVEITGTNRFAFDSFHNEANFDPFFENRDASFLGQREVLLSQRIETLAPDPILAGKAAPGTLLIARIYAADGSVIGEATDTANQAGNWVINFFGVKPAGQARIVIEHVATEGVALGETDFSLGLDTYRSLQLDTMHENALTVGSILSNNAGKTLENLGRQNINPLNLL